MLSIAVFMPNRDELSPPSANPHCAKGLEVLGASALAATNVSSALIVSPVRQCVERTSPGYQVKAQSEYL